MTPRANLTFTALLDHVQALLLRTARGRRALPARAYLADHVGRVMRVDLPALEGAAEHEAAGAVVGALMREHASAHAVLQLPHHANGRGGASEIVGLYAVAHDGVELGRRLLPIERRADGRIARLVGQAACTGHVHRPCAAARASRR